ncbi:MAG: helix-hairpin-helix domain-containing protein [Prevotellaceae bacterium]|jgi:competence ComEA-like helix-hairpin-helix protein|nr:helix-hairpin-helix domain-containing protein [Prevotellaceae bacterium]
MKRKHSKRKSSSRFIPLIIKEWFIFLNSERTGITALIVILLFIIILPLFFRNNEIAAEDMDRLKNEMDVFLAEMEKQSSKNKRDTLFMFDPNEIDSASLILLGFSPRQAKSIVNYRNKGGKFYSKESFGKSFVVSEEMYARLYYYLDIKQEFRKKGEIRKMQGTIRENAEIAEVKESKESNETRKKIYTIELNSADFAELQKFRGIGEYYAKKIVEYRDKLGGFHKPEQLMEIRGIDSARFEMFRDQVTIDTSHIKQININIITETELAKHPYINNFTAKAIIKYRNFKETITSLDEMINEKVINEQQAKKIKAYIKMEK